MAEAMEERPAEEAGAVVEHAEAMEGHGPIPIDRLQARSDDGR